ncbi:MAG: ABC transporter permease [Thermoguttaceae bacterium]|nr:ABC transporter permease [Thermoguttaceae bacterium]
MNLWKIAYRSIQHRTLASSLTALSISLGVALVVTVLVINGVISKSFQQGAQGYDLILGPKGSELELVMSTVFYNRKPMSLIPYRYYDLLRTSRYSAEVDSAVPIARTDNFMDYPVIATNTDYFRKIVKSDGKPYTLRDGEFFKNTDTYGAVIGYTVAKQTGRKVGDQIQFGHSGPDGELHEPFTVVGVLDHTGSPNDRAVFVNLEGFYKQHEHQQSAFDVDYSLVEAEKQERLAANRHEEEADADHDHDADHDADHEHAEADHDHEGHDHDGHDHERRLSAVLIITKEKSVEIGATAADVDRAMEQAPGVEIEETQLVSKKQKRKVHDLAVTALPEKLSGELLDAQAVAPVSVIASFYQDVIGNIRYVLIIFAVQVIIVAGIGMMVSIYNSMSERRQEIAIMRALGAKRTTVMAIILFESILLSLGGGFLGLIIGHGLAAAISPWVMEYSNVLIRPWDFQLVELILIPGLVILASIVGYLPAVVAYRTDVAQSLQP